MGVREKLELMGLRSLRVGLVLGLVAICVSAAACGNDEERDVPGAPQPDHVRAVERNPYLVTCGDLSRQPQHPDAERLVIHAEFALAQDPALRKTVAKETFNRTGRSVYYALTVI